MKLAGLACGATWLLAATAAGAEPDGRALYFGLGPDAPKARIGRVESAALTCAGCHGRDGARGGEGKVAVPAIDGASLRKTGLYDEASFARALTDGMAPGGRTLSAAMPRFSLSRAETDAVWRFLGSIGEEDRSGVSAGRIVIAIAAPADRREDAEAMRSALVRRWARAGDAVIYGRDVAFSIVTLDPGDDGRKLSVLRPFVALGPLVGPGGETLTLLHRAGIPIIAPRGDVPPMVDAIRIRSGDAEVHDRLRAILRSGGIEIGAKGAAAPLATEGLVVVTAEARAFETFAASRPSVAGRRIVLPMALAVQAPGAVGLLMDGGADVIALRPAGDPSDPTVFAHVIATLLERALVETGRDLTRSRFLTTLRRLRIETEGWPSLDFSRNPATDAIQAIRLTRRP